MQWKNYAVHSKYNFPRNGAIPIKKPCLNANCVYKNGYMLSFTFDIYEMFQFFELITKGKHIEFNIPNA